MKKIYGSHTNSQNRHWNEPEKGVAETIKSNQVK